MPSNIIGTIHIDAALTKLAIGYQNEEMIADLVMPRVKVAKESDKYYVYDKSNFRTGEDDLWARGTEPHEVQLRISDDSYACVRRALEEFVDNDDVKNADAPIDPMRDATFDLVERLRIKAEKRVATAIRTVANNGGTASPADKWDDYANSDPIGDVKAGIISVRGRIAKRPNTVIFPWSVYETLKDHPDFTDRIKYTQIGVVTSKLMASIFEVANVRIAGALENTAVEGQPDVLADVWGDDVWIGYVAPKPGIKVVSWGYQFTWQTWMTERYAEFKRRGQVVRQSINDTQKVVAADAGYLLTDTLT